MLRVLENYFFHYGMTTSTKKIGFFHYAFTTQNREQ
jgi:hypothetical protein